MFSFEVLAEDPNSRARRGRLTTPHGIVETPAFMPVGTRAAVKTLAPWELREMNIAMLLSNAFHLYLKPGLEIIEAMGGLHRFMSWDKAILTDSGGFQIFSLASSMKLSDEGVSFASPYDGSKHFFTPELVVEIQERLGVDVAMVLDQCPPYDAERELVNEAVQRTTAWAERSIKAWSRKDTALFGIVQGGIHPELRQDSAMRLVEMEFPGYAIGGLSVGEPQDEMLEVLDYTVPLLPNDKPRYLMGVGDPVGVTEAIQRGVDLFDCVLPTRLARHGTVFVPEGQLNIRNSVHKKDAGPLDRDCSCPTCANFSRAYLRHQFMTGETLALRLLTLHNLHFLTNLISIMRQNF